MDQRSLIDRSRAEWVRGVGGTDVRTGGSPTRFSASDSAHARAEPAGVVVATPIESPPQRASRRGLDQLVRVPRTLSSSPPLLRSTSLRESERRAASLLEQGRTVGCLHGLRCTCHEESALRATDERPDSGGALGIPYEPKTAASRDSPTRLRAGKASLAAGDPDRALALAKEAMGILDKRVGEFRPQLREDVKDLIEQAKVAVTAANEIIYQRDRS